MSSNSDQQDVIWMRHALKLAEMGAANGEVPVGAVVVAEGNILGEGWNQPISANDPTAHAELVALRNAASQLQNYRLPDTTLYVTIEPCTMCVGAAIHARIDRLVFGAREPRAGAVCSALNLLDEKTYNHRIKWKEGVLTEECAALIRDFFQRRREQVRLTKN